MFVKHDPSGYKRVLDGIEMKTLNHGEKMLMAEFLLEKGHTLPRHAHPHEQSGYLVKGCFLLSIGTDVFEVHPGDSWCVPGGVEHGAEIVEDTIAVEVFCPVREDYLP